MHKRIMFITANYLGGLLDVVGAASGRVDGHRQHIATPGLAVILVFERIARLDPSWGRPGPRVRW
jgi:hypothetical protein